VTLESILESLKKYGVKAVLVIWILRAEARLNVVEDKLWNCYTSMQMMTAHRTAQTKTEWYAILPHHIDVKKDIKRYTTA
jgi:hypothetical protein